MIFLFPILDYISPKEAIFPPETIAVILNCNFFSLSRSSVFTFEISKVLSH